MPTNFFKVSKSDKSGLNKWPLGRVVHIYPSKDGLVRTVRLLMADGHLMIMANARARHHI